MRYACLGLVILWLWLPTDVSASPVQDQRASPAEQFQSLVREQEAASSPGRLLSDEERMAFIGTVFRRWNALALRLIALAEAHPDDPIALDALVRAVWQVNSTPWPVGLVGPDEGRARALELLVRRHLRSDRLGPVCERVYNGLSRDYETFLRAVRRGTPHRDVRAISSVSLARCLRNRLQRRDLIDERPALGEEFAGLFGRAELDLLRRQDRRLVEGEIESLLEEAARDFAAVPWPAGGTVGEEAGADLYELRHLSVGKPAPELAGVDQDGGRYRLSDDRGKVVLLDFWSEY